MFCIKGSKHLFLIGFNPRCYLPVWSNIKEDAVMADFGTIQQIRKFLKENLGVETDIEYV